MWHWHLVEANWIENIFMLKFFYQSLDQATSKLKFIRWMKRLREKVDLIWFHSYEQYVTTTKHENRSISYYVFKNEEILKISKMWDLNCRMYGHIEYKNREEKSTALRP